MAEILDRVKAGERPGTLAAQYGVSRQAIFNRMRMLSESGEHQERTGGVCWLTPHEEAAMDARLAEGPPEGHHSWTVVLLRQWARKQYGKLLYLPRLREFAHYRKIFGHEVTDEGQPARELPRPVPVPQGSEKNSHTPLKKLRRIVMLEKLGLAPKAKLPEKATAPANPSVPRGPKTEGISLVAAEALARKYANLKAPATPSAKAPTPAPPAKPSVKPAPAAVAGVYNTPLPDERPKYGKRGRPPGSLNRKTIERDAPVANISPERMQKFMDERKAFHEELMRANAAKQATAEAAAAATAPAAPAPPAGPSAAIKPLGAPFLPGVKTPKTGKHAKGNQLPKKKRK